MLILCGIKKQHKDSIASVFSFTQSHYFFGIRVVIKTHLKPRFIESTCLICPKILSLMQRNVEIDIFLQFGAPAQFLSATPLL